MKHALFAATLFAATLQASTISINYTPADKTAYLESGKNYGLVPVPSQNWIQITDKMATGIALLDQNAQPTAAQTSLNTYAMQDYATHTSYNGLLRSAARDYMDSTHPGFPQIKVSGIPYSRYDLYLYMCNPDWNKASAATICYDGSNRSPYYYMDGYLTKTSTTNTGWGDRTGLSVKLGTNCLRIPDCSGANVMIETTRNDSNYWRASVCALQIVERVEIRFSGDITLDRAAYAQTSLDIICESENATLTFTGTANPAALTISGSPFTLKLDAPITASYAEFHTNLALDIEAALSTLNANAAAPIITAPIVKDETVAFTLTPLALFEGYLTPSDTAISVIARRVIPAAGASAISVNFGSDLATLAGQSGDVGVYPVDASLWLNTPSSGNTGPTPATTVIEIVTDNSGTLLNGTSIQACGKGIYSSGNSATLIGKLMYGYIDDELSSSTNNAGFQVTNIPYSQYAAIIYFNTDAGNTAFASPRINGSYYTGQVSPAFTRPVGGAANFWGTPSTTQLTEGQNYLLVSGLTNTTLLVNSPEWSTYQKRTSISGFQIVDMSTLESAETFTATHPGGEIAFSEIVWDGGATFTPGEANIATLALQSDATLTLDTNDLSLLKIAISCPGTLRLILTGAEPQIGGWDLHNVKELEINASTYAPATVSRPPLAWLHTDPAASVTTRPGETFELRAGTPEAPATYAVTYAGGALRVPSGTYIYNTTAGGTIQTSLELGPDATLKMGATGTNNFSIGKMNARISGGTIIAGRLIAAQGNYNPNSPSTILQTGGDITLSHTGTDQGNTQPILLGNQTGSPCTYTMTGGTLTALNGYFKLGHDSRADFTLQGGRVQAIGLIGVNSVNRSLTLSGGEFALGAYGIPAIANSSFTLGGGHLTAIASNRIATPFTLAEGTTSTLSAATGQTLDFTAALAGSASLLIGDSLRNGTITLHDADIGGDITLQSGNLTLNGNLQASPANYRYLRLTVTDWPKTTPDGTISQPGTGLVISEIQLLLDGATVPWQTGRVITSTPAARENYWASNIADGNFTNNYYCDTATPAAGKYIITIDRTDAATAFNAYSIYSGVNNGRNPLAWALEGSPDSTTWFLLDTQTLTLTDIATWNDSGRTATIPGPNQGRTFTLPPRTPTLTVSSDCTLAGTGTIAHAIAFQADSSLVKTGTPEEALTALGTISLPENGKVSVQAPPPAASGTKHYLLRGEATATLDLARFAPAENYGIGRDADGIFTRRRSGLVITLY